MMGKWTTHHQNGYSMLCFKSLDQKLVPFPSRMVPQKRHAWLQQFQQKWKQFLGTKTMVSVLSFPKTGATSVTNGRGAVRGPRLGLWWWVSPDLPRQLGFHSNPIAIQTIIILGLCTWQTWFWSWCRVSGCEMGGGVGRAGHKGGSRQDGVGLRSGN